MAHLLRFRQNEQKIEIYAGNGATPNFFQGVLELKEKINFNQFSATNILFIVFEINKNIPLKKKKTYSRNINHILEYNYPS